MNGQLCLVLAEEENSHAAKIYRYEGDRLVDIHPVVIGEKGITFDKKEGDRKTPAGVFTFGSVFGFQECALKMPYILVNGSLECVDDPKSRYYNQFVSRTTARDWDSSEKMSTIPLYKWGIFVNHNVEQIPHKGSCIFFHLWKSAAQGTAGCTAMEEEKLKELILWLDPDKTPLLVQLARKDYETYRTKWDLPKGLR